MMYNLKSIMYHTGRFFLEKRNRRFLYLLAISVIALLEFSRMPTERKTFVYFSTLEGNLVVEERMLYKAPDEETGIQRYLEEVLLGPVSPGLDPLFPRETRLSSFMFRDGVVYANLTEAAALPPPGYNNVFRGLFVLNEGIRRNFPQVKDVKLFIGGNEVFFREFQWLFGNSADNIKTSL